MRTVKKIISVLSGLGISRADILKLIEYLIYYRYLKSEDFSWLDFIDAISNLQRQAGLKVDGEAGPKTLRTIYRPRCAVKEGLATSEYRWGIRELSYYIKGRDKDLSSDKWDAEIAKAFIQWSDVANLKFTRINDSRSANFILDVGYGRRDGFDGPQGTLAWAELPPGNSFKGQLTCKFDTSENWLRILLLNVACHEFGHLLGLRHSNNNRDLMAPFYDRNVSKPQNGDIVRIQRLYGPPRNTPKPQPTPTPTPSPSNVTTIIIKGNVEDIDIGGYRVQKLD